MKGERGITMWTNALLLGIFILLLLPTSSKCDRPVPRCSSVLDLAFLLDMSGSVGLKNWQKQLIPFLEKFLDAMDIGPESVHTSMTLYSTEVHVKWLFNEVAYHNPVNLRKAVSDLKKQYKGGSTMTGLALQELYKKVMWSNGARDDVPKLLVILTDGKASDRVEVPAANLRQKGCVIVVVGIAAARASECRKMAGCAANDQNCKRYIGTDWNKMESILKDVIKSVCESLPVDAVCNDWENWSSCSQTCGDGRQQRKRKVPLTIKEQQPGSNGVKGKTCEEQGADEQQARKCNLKPCPVDAGCGSVGAWSSCTETCGGGTQDRIRSPWNEPPAQHGGKTCEQQGFQEKETQACNTDPCPIDATPGPWSPWTPCSVTCGYGTRKRSRTVEVREAHGGRSLEEQNIHLEEKETCQNFPCGPCHYKWAEWTPCTRTCDSGYKTRHSAVKFDYPDHICPAELYETQTCFTTPCAPPIVPDGEAEEGAGGNTNTAAIAGGIVGGLALLGALGGGAYYYRHSGSTAPGVESQPITEGFTKANPDVSKDEESVSVDADSDFWHSSD